MRKAGEKLLGLYMISAMFMAAYFNWQYAHEHGFWKWALFGEMVPTIKAAAWPYFLWSDRVQAKQREEREAVHRLEPLLDAAAASGETGLKWKDTPMRDIPRSVFDEFRSVQQRIVKEGSNINVEVLNRVYPQLGTMFSEKLLKSMMMSEQISNEAIAQRTLSAETLQGFAEAHKLEVEWAEWLNPRLKEINTALRQRW